MQALLYASLYIWILSKKYVVHRNFQNRFSKKLTVRLNRVIMICRPSQAVWLQKSLPSCLLSIARLSVYIVWFNSRQNTDSQVEKNQPCIRYNGIKVSHDKSELYILIKALQTQSRLHTLKLFPILEKPLGW